MFLFINTKYFPFPYSCSPNGGLPKRTRVERVVGPGRGSICISIDFRCVTNCTRNHLMERFHLCWDASTPMQGTLSWAFRAERSCWSSRSAFSRPYRDPAQTKRMRQDRRLPAILSPVAHSDGRTAFRVLSLLILTRAAPQFVTPRSPRR